MTAEVAILNKSAVALAADSAVTVGEGDSGKVYNTVNKLFTLSKRHPVGLMIYANAEYMGVPFETAIKMFRAKLGNQSFARIEQYAAEFVKFLRGPLFSSKEQQAANILRIWSVVFESMRSDVRQALVEFTPEKVEAAVEAVTAQHLRRLQRAESYPGFEKVSLPELFKQHKDQWANIRNEFSFSSQSKSVQRAWRRIAEYALTRQHASYQAYSGIVVAGFGEAEMFPQVAVTRTSGLVGGAHRHDPIVNQGISHDGAHAGIMPFAQSEMVDRFMTGVDMRYEHYVAGSIVSALLELAKGIIDVHVPGTEDERSKIREQVEKSILSQAKVLRNEAKAWRVQRFEQPVMQAVINLPKEELANLAEALVNLTSIKRRVSTERETVGGPIDVAVISKGDGFIWIKRKHYFSKELNPHFVPNYNISTEKEHVNGVT